MMSTNKLRFVKRVVPVPEHGEGIGKTVRVLQQWWEEQQNTSNLGWTNVAIGQPPKGEWRDVPLETE